MPWPPKSAADLFDPANFARIRDAIVFCEEFQRVRVLTDGGGGALLRRSPGTKSCSLDLRGSAVPVFPSEDGQAGKVLGTNGRTRSWVASGARFNTKVVRGTAQGLANATGTAITFTSAAEDNDGLWNAGAPTRLTIPATSVTATYAGRWAFWAFITYDANATGARFAYVLRNGSTAGIVCHQAVSGGIGTIIQVSEECTMAAGDYFELYGQQWSGGALNVLAAQLTVIRIGD